ncbi:peptidoglycan-binding protein [Salipaludibacillus aurantiacus]|uniref:Peptidoglycan-binding (PGRP) domain of peptidoglycan hydrolases-containing protein n=1 Tax=Salipaludibacillus aurantiacus TaxID=1601833 RepID=A0A1H9VG00_9BACI|nr:peptidoglycan-binding protein [Salipaludibacillus aurantiacus]SES20203.1 Peptidoglycan-binding (PGRP) domain of peptidoglycan hydrolases-containing protein [Salipaludibacillus aurantiacus]
MKKVVMSVVLAGSLLVMPTAYDAALGDQTLREGIRHGDVTELQDALRDTGHFSANSTGYFGSITRQAVRDFQRSEGLAVDGIAGPQTFSALGVSGSSSNASQVSQSSGNSTISFNTVLRRGARGAQVRELQSALADRGFKTSSQVDGVYGPLTQQAVRDFQRSAGISVDGIAGPQTYGALNGSSSSSSSSSASSSSSSSSSSNATTVSSSSSSSVDAMISTARSVIGSKYQWGGTTPSGFDCSGFINYVYNQHGKSIPRTVSQMYSAATKVSSPSRGDIVFFETRTGPSHAGIYLGNGQFIHSGASTGVTVSNMSNPYWSAHYIGAGRL